MNQFLGYLIQPLAFFIVAGLFVKVMAFLKLKFSQQPIYPHLSSGLRQVPDSIKKLEAEYARFQFHEFDAFSANEPYNSLWNELCQAYWQELNRAKGFFRLPAQLIKFQWSQFPFLEVFFPILIFTAYLLFILLEKYELMVTVIDIINYWVIAIIVILGLLAFVPVQAYRNLVKANDLNKLQQKRIMLALFLMHLSHYLRIWGFFWKIQYVLKWLLTDSKVPSTQDQQQ